jgi:hypothetical protein
MSEVEAAPVVQMATTERGRKLGNTDEEVNLALRLLVMSGKPKKAVEQLEEAGYSNIGSEQLRKWRDNQFPRRYAQLRQDLSSDVGENLAGQMLERALESDEVEKKFIREAAAKVGSVPPAHLAKSILALAQSKAQNVEKSELLRGRPTDRVEVDINASIQVLERLGVVERQEAIDVEVVEEGNG